MILMKIKDNSISNLKNKYPELEFISLKKNYFFVDSDSYDIFITMSTNKNIIFATIID